LIIKLSKKEEKREERNQIAGLFVFDALKRNQQSAIGEMRSDIPRQ